MSAPGVRLDLSAAASATAAQKRQREEVKSRSTLGADDAGSHNDPPSRQAIASLSAQGVKLAEGETPAKRRLIIPLQAAEPASSQSGDALAEPTSSSGPDTKESAESGAAGQPTDAQAAAALIAELEGASAAKSAPKVTHISMEADQHNYEALSAATESSSAQKSVLKGDSGLKSQLFAHPSRAISGANAGSLLMRARQSRADDIAALPDAPSFHSSTYDSVPIDEFGAAVLRGMGATDEQLEGGTGNEPHKLNTYRGGRGLGAGSNVLQELDEAFRKGGKVRRDGTQVAPSADEVMKKLRSGQYEAQAAAQQAAADRAKAAKAAKTATTPGRYKELSVGSVVQVNRSSHPAHDVLGVIVKCDGVPGLEAVELRVALHALPSLRSAKLGSESTWGVIAEALDTCDKALKAFVVPEPEVCISLISPMCRAAASHSPVAGGLDLLKEQMGANLPVHAAGTLVLRVSKAFCQRRSASSMSPEQHAQAGAAVAAQHTLVAQVETQAKAFVQRLDDIVTGMLREKGAALQQQQKQQHKERAAAASSQGGSKVTDRGVQERSGEAQTARSRETQLKPSASSSADSQRRGWVRQGVRVRIVDRRNRYYKYKAAVLDVTQPRVAVLRVENERRSILEDMHERDLETVIPRQDNARVMVLAGSYAGTTGRLLSRDSRASTAEVHLDDDGANEKFSYDDICALA